MKLDVLRNLLYLKFILGSCTAQVNITTPPEDITVCKNSDVIVNCGYQWASRLRTTWLINGTAFTQDQLQESPLYRLNNFFSPTFSSLTVKSINGSTTFQCVVASTPTTSSRLGTVTVIGALSSPVPTYEATLNEILVSWSPVYSDTMCGPVTYNINVMPSHGIIMMINDTVYSITGLNYNTNYTITVYATNNHSSGEPTTISVAIKPFPPILTPTVTTVSVTALNPQIVGQSVTLQCEVTTMRGISSRVDIVWSSDGIELERMNNVSSTTMSSSLVYTDYYTISQLSTTDDNRVIQCVGMIIGIKSVVDNIIVDVTVPTPTVAIMPSGPIQGAMVGDPQVINCTVSTVSGVESSSVIISWMGPGGVITDDSRVIMSPTTSSGNSYTSILHFTYLMEGDDGTYTCNVMILETNGSQSVELQSLTRSNSDSLSTGAAITIAVLVTFIITLTATAIVTSIVTYICCVKKKFEGTLNLNEQSPQEKALYEQVSLPSHTASKNEVELQSNPAYGTSHKVVMDTNPAYESCK